MQTDEVETDEADRAAGLVMLGTILFFAVVGIGVGVFLEQPAIGGLGGGAFGILVGFIVIPGLRDG